MWKKLLIIFFIFYFFAILQNSFLTHFSLFGTTPNLVFILFFLLTFFEKKDDSYSIIFLALVAGFFSDIFSYTYLGPSIALFITIGFLLRGVQSLLKNRKDSHPFIYFLPLFVVFLLAYSLLLGACLYFLDPNKIAIGFDMRTVFSTIYNIVVATVLFYFYKKLVQAFADDRQLTLFMK